MHDAHGHFFSSLLDRDPRGGAPRSSSTKLSVGEVDRDLVALDLSGRAFSFAKNQESHGPMELGIGEQRRAQESGRRTSGSRHADLDLGELGPARRRCPDWTSMR
jgi:hypothetical protein